MDSSIGPRGNPTVRIGGIRGLLGFSRVLQASLSVAQPFAAALVALHGFPPGDRLALGLSAAWAGFLAVFALNDLLDVEVDRKRFAHLRDLAGFDIDSAMARHPLAQRQISLRWGLAWIGSLAAYALTAAWFLSPAAALLFGLAALLETIYCKLARVTALKFLVSGAMVGVGALAGWVAMTPEVRLWEMGLIFLWMYVWEIGGRNVVNDFADVEEDARLGIKTVPLVYGPTAAAWVTFAFLIATIVSGILLRSDSLLYMAGSTVAGVYLLLLPGLTLLRDPTPASAMALFNRASFYPPAILAVLLATL